MIAIIVETFGKMSDAELRKSSKLQKTKFSTVQDAAEEHAVEDAIVYLEPIRSQFANQDWGKLVASKTKIVSLMTKSSTATDA